MPHSGRVFLEIDSSQLLGGIGEQIVSSFNAISSDSHIIEPADLWEKRLAPKFRERGPRLVHEGDMDQWYCDGVKFGDLGSNQQAGLRFEEPEKLTHQGSQATVPAGGLDPDVHIKDMDLDGIAGGVLYPSQGLTMFRVPACDVLTASFKVYNDYIAEFCKPYPNRLKGIAMINVDDAEEGIQELERAAEMGLGGALISVRPMIGYDQPVYNRFWAAAQDLDMPLSLHTGTIRWRPGMDLHIDNAFTFRNKDVEVRDCINAMIFSKVFEEYPQLKVGSVEFEVAWAPFYMRDMDYFYKQRATGIGGTRFKGDTLPSDFFRNNLFISFQEDDLGIELRHRVGVDNLLWASDYPHAEGTFPKSREILDRIFQGVPEDEKVKIAGGNAARIYHFG